MVHVWEGRIKTRIRKPRGKHRQPEEGAGEERMMMITYVTVELRNSAYKTICCSYYIIFGP